MKKFWKDHSLPIVLVTLLAVQTTYSLIAGHFYWSQDMASNGPFLLWWSWQYNMSILADVFGGIVLIMGSKYLREKNTVSDERTDRDDGGL